MKSQMETNKVKAKLKGQRNSNVFFWCALLRMRVYIYYDVIMKSIFFSISYFLSAALHQQWKHGSSDIDAEDELVKRSETYVKNFLIFLKRTVDSSPLHYIAHSYNSTLKDLNKASINTTTSLS